MTRPLLDARLRRRIVAHDVTESVALVRSFTAPCGHTFATLLRLPAQPKMCPECWVSLELGS